MNTFASTSGPLVLAVNAGSSSVKAALFDAHGARLRHFSAAIDSIGAAASCFRVSDGSAGFARQFAIPDHVTAARVLTDWLQERVAPQALAAIGHRVVYGGARFGLTQLITAPLLEALFSARSHDAEHLPQEQHLIETLARAFPAAASVACFDTSFHRSMPPVAAMLPIPRRYFEAGVRRHGFHGLSCAFMMGELGRLGAGGGRVVLAHLGGGASVTAVQDGHSIDTSMGLTPAGGMPMATRSGDIDPGLAWRLARDHGVGAAEFNRMMQHEAGLKGISGTTGDMRELLRREAVDSAAAEAVAMFCYQAGKQIAAMAAAMGGIDTLVFAGGIGENAAAVRARICAGLGFIGIHLAPSANGDNAPVISTPASAVTVRIIASDEQAVIAEETCRVLPGLAAAPAAEVGHG